MPVQDLEAVVRDLAPRGNYSVRGVLVMPVFADQSLLDPMGGQVEPAMRVDLVVMVVMGRGHPPMMVVRWG